LPALIVGLVLVLVVAALSAVVWVWSVRKPPSPPALVAEQAQEQTPRPFSYAAIGNTNIDLATGRAASPDDIGWAARLHTYLPSGTLFTTLGDPQLMLRDANATATPMAAAGKHDLVTLWTVVVDSTRGTPLTAYLGELRTALDLLTGEADTLVVMPNLPDLTLLMLDQSEEHRVLVRGGIEHWNRVIAEAVSRYGRRVLLIDLYSHSAHVLDPDAGNAALADAIWRELRSMITEETAKREK
jgi:hypothetical protein